MGRTPDRHPGVSIEEGMILTPEGAATEEGELRYTGSRFSFYDATGEYDPRSGGGGITEGQHEVLDTLVHDLSENYYLETTRSSGRVTDIIAWTDSGKTLKIREVNVTRSAGLVSQVVEKQYDGTGTLKYTMTYTITRTGGQISSVDAVKT